MKTLLDELKDEVAILNGWSSFNDMAGQYDCPKFVVDEVAKRYAIEVAKETLNNASNSAKTIRTAKDGSWSVTSPMIRTAKALHYVDKQSILSEDNIPKELL